MTSSELKVLVAHVEEKEHNISAITKPNNDLEGDCQNAVFIECFTPPISEEQFDCYDDDDNDASVYYEEEVIDDDDDLTVEHDHLSDIGSYEEVTIGEDELLDDEEEEEEVISDEDVKIVELPEGGDDDDDDDGHGLANTIMQNVCMGGDDGSPGAIESIGSNPERIVENSYTLQKKMQSTITEGARKAMLEKVAREQTLKEVAERRQKQRQLVQNETDKLKHEESLDSIENKPKVDRAARTPLMDEVQRINDSVSKNAATAAAQANNAPSPLRKVVVGKKNHSLVEAAVKAENSVSESTCSRSRRNENIGSDTVSQNSPRSVSQYQDISSSSNGGSPSPKKSYSVGLARLSSSLVPIAAAPLRVEDECSCIESNVPPSIISLHDTDTAITASFNSVELESQIPVKKKSFDLGDQRGSAVADKTSVLSTCDVGLVRSVVAVAATDGSTSSECVAEKTTTSTPSLYETLDSPVILPSKRVSKKNTTSSSNDDLEDMNAGAKVPSLARLEQSPPLSTGVKKNVTKSLIQAFESPLDPVSTPSSAGGAGGQLSIPPIFTSSPATLSPMPQSPGKRATFFPNKFSPDVPSMFRAFQESTSAGTRVPPDALPFQQDDEGGFHSLQDLQLWKADGIDMKRREQYLSPAEFQHHFKMTKEEFSKLPKWKRDKTKRSLKLF